MDSHNLPYIYGKMGKSKEFFEYKITMSANKLSVVPAGVPIKYVSVGDRQYY